MKITITIKADTVNIYNGDSYMDADIEDGYGGQPPQPVPTPPTNAKSHDSVMDKLRRLIDDKLPPNPQNMLNGATTVPRPQPVDARMQQALDASLFNMLFGAEAGDDCTVLVGDTLFHISGCGCSPKSTKH